MKFSSSRELRIFASDISSNEDFTNAEFKRLVKPLLIPRMPDTENSRKVQSVSTFVLTLKIVVLEILDAICSFPWLDFVFDIANILFRELVPLFYIVYFPCLKLHGNATHQWSLAVVWINGY